MFSNTKCLDDAENYCTFFRNKAKNAGRSRKNAVMQSNKATCGISRTIVGRLTPMLASYTYTCIAPLGEYISMHVKGCCCLRFCTVTDRNQGSHEICVRIVRNQLRQSLQNFYSQVFRSFLINVHRSNFSVFSYLRFTISESNIWSMM